MAVKTRAELEEYFETGDEPTQAQFQDLLDSMILKSELGEDGPLDPYPAGDGNAITNLNLPDPLPALDGSALTGISLAEYNDLEDTPSFATTTTFTLSGDKTSVFDVHRRIRVQLDNGYLYTHVKSRTYDTPSDTTTVETTEAMTSTTMIAVGLSAFTPAASGGAMTMQMVGWPPYTTTGGTGNAYTATISGISITAGMGIPLLINRNNTGASTLNVNGTGNYPVKLSGADLATDTLVQNYIAVFLWNPTLNIYELKDPATSSLSLKAKMTAYSPSGSPHTHNFQNWMQYYQVYLQGAGAGGGGGATSDGKGGGAGAYASAVLDGSGITSGTATVGEGGPGGSGSGGDGEDGEASSWADGSNTITAGGGTGGDGDGGAVGAGGTASGDYDDKDDSRDASRSGAHSRWGQGGAFQGNGGPDAANGYGSGGGGGDSSGSSAGTAGTNGRIIIVEWGVG